MKITLRTSKDNHGQVSLSQAARHYSQLVHTLGFGPATRTAVATAIQLFRADGGSIQFRQGQLDDNDCPVLRGAPRRWGMTIRHLIGIVNWYGKHSFPPDHIPQMIRRLTEVVQLSGNSPDIATVTILIPAYDHFVEVAMCIESIATAPTRVNYTIFVSDDASPNCSFSAMGGIPGIRVIRRSANGGYIENINSAAREVGTEYLLTLNQDVLVCPGWLDEIVDEIQRNPKNAIIGPRILDQQFKILEAGALIFQDAHASHRGRGSVADEPQFAHTREVDYVSGCAMLVRTAVWNQLGGLDERYKPAYYDDVDLCIRAHKAGWRVRYAPLSCVIHFEGTSMGRDENNEQSLKNFQNINRSKIADTHYDVLSQHTRIEDIPHVDTHYQYGLNVVCVFEGVPQADRDGGAVDFVLFVNYLLALDFQVAALFTREIAPEETIQWRGQGVLCDTLTSDLGKQLMANADVVMSFGTMVGIRLCSENLTAKRWVHHTSDIATRRLRGMNATFKDDADVSAEASRWFLGLPRDEEQMWEIEKPILEKPSKVLFVTEHDLQYALDNGAVGTFAHFPILKGGPDIIDVPAPLNQPTVGFVGSFLHSPNPDAVEYFLRDIWSIVYTAVPTARFLIWGSGLNSTQIANWSKIHRVEVRGWFATWDEVVAQTRVLVSPLRFGAGMKHKVVSTFIYGRPVVGTAISFEGFKTDLLGGKVMTDDPAQIANSLIEILQSNEAWTSALHAGLAGMGAEFSKAHEIERIRKMFEETLAN